MARKPPKDPSEKAGKPPFPKDWRDVAITKESMDSLPPDVVALIEALINDVTRAESTDKQTGLPNMEGFKWDLARASRGRAGSDDPAHEERDPEKASHVSVVFIDANDFGQVNKSMGDRIGDVTIEAVSQYFKKRLRSDDIVVARKGGDEFLLVMRCPEEEAKNRMQALKKGFSEEVTRKVLEAAATAYPNNHVGKIAHYQAALAKKHKNAKLKDKPFELSFSFGVHEVDEAMRQELGAFIPKDLDKHVTNILDRSDECMREDKEAYRKAMHNYGKDVDSPARRINKGDGPEHKR